jgi:anti-sigma regulatory factor (Ser/Thr protein kinase)
VTLARRRSADYTERLRYDVRVAQAPENIAMTSGRGLLLMRAYMDDVQILVSPEGGNEIVMTKAIAGPCSKD